MWSDVTWGCVDEEDQLVWMMWFCVNLKKGWLLQELRNLGVQKDQTLASISITSLTLLNKDLRKIKERKDKSEKEKS